MKVIDLAIGFSEGIIPPKIKYKGFIYEYLKDIKDYIRLENGHIKTLEINVEQFNDEVEIIDDDHLEKIKKEDLINHLVKDCGCVIEDTPKEDKKIKRLSKCFFTDYDDIFTEWVATYNGVIVDKLNELIDKVNGE